VFGKKVDSRTVTANFHGAQPRKLPDVKMVELGDKCSDAPGVEAYQTRYVISGEVSPEHIRATDKPKTYARGAVGKT
jgi:hypothetical protein